MTVNEKAKEYAKSKALEAMSAAIEQAFVEGYNQGYSEGRDDEKNSRPATTSLDDFDEVTFVDLGLPSGTKWASKYLKDKAGNTVYLTYDEAAKFNIPTYEQFQELLSYAKKERVNIKGTANLHYYEFLGDNGEGITLENASYRTKSHVDESLSQGQSLFWLKADNSSCDSKTQRCAYINGYINQYSYFKGYMLPIIIVS